MTQILYRGGFHVGDSFDQDFLAAQVFGHKEGANRVREVIEESAKLGIPYLTLYAFSEENWKRPPKEVSFLMELLNVYLVRERVLLKKNNIRLLTIGNLCKLPEKTQSLIQETKEFLSDGDGMCLTLALSYSGRSELTDVCQKIALAVAAGKIKAHEIDEKTLQLQMTHPEMPDIDLLIRTSGEQRISNFMLWQLSYAELYFTDVFWPEFDHTQFHLAIEAYKRRERRYGNLSSDELSESNSEVLPKRPVLQMGKGIIC